MARGFIGFAFAALVVALVSAGNAQQEPATDSTADAAREQKEPSKKKPAPKKVYTNSDLGKSDSPTTKTDARTSSSENLGGTQASSSNTDQAAKNQKNPSSGDSRSSILDRRKQDSPETIIVPRGTKITVDISEENPPRNIQLRLHTGKVVNIVQVGSTVVIPALSKVTIQDSGGAMELTAVTIEGARYELQTDRVPVQEASISEITFTVAKDFTIKR